MAQLFGTVSEETPWEWARKRRTFFSEPIKDALSGIATAAVTAALSYWFGTKDWRQSGTIALTSGVAAAFGLPTLETLYWRVRRSRILLEEANSQLRQAIAQLQRELFSGVATDALPEKRPKVALVRYGEDESRRYFDGLIFLNEGETAYDLFVPDVHIGDVRIAVAGNANILKHGDELFCEVLIHEAQGDISVDGMFEFMRERKINEIPVSIRYRDFDGNWYETRCVIQRNVLAKGGIGIGPFSQVAIPAAASSVQS